MSAPLHLAVGLDGAGWHPAAWREDDADPSALFSARHRVALAREAEAGLLDLVTFEDSLALQSTAAHLAPDDRTDQVRGRLDAVLVACRVAPSTTSIGLVPSVTATHTEPFHVSKAVATLDFVSRGRAGVRVQVSPSLTEARLVGRRDLTTYADDSARDDDLAAEAADHVEVQRRLWDSWEDGAEIRDVASGRFVDRGRLHAVDFEGDHFSVRGPSITPRPPQGQPLVVVSAHDDRTLRLAARAADVVLVSGPAAVAGVWGARTAAGRTEPLRVLRDLVVVLGDTDADARARLDRLDARAGGEVVGPDGPEVFVGTAGDLADLLGSWSEAGLDGARLLPATLPGDLLRITGDLVPELQRRGAFRTAYDGGSLRRRLGLARPVSRYAAVGA